MLEMQVLMALVQMLDHQEMQVLLELQDQVEVLDQMEMWEQMALVPQMVVLEMQDKQVIQV